MKLFQICLFFLVGFYISLIGDARLTSADETSVAQQVFPSEETISPDREPAQESIPEGLPTDVAAKAIAPAGKDKFNVGVVSMGTEDIQDINELSKIRKELAQQQNKKNLLVDTTRRFPVESFTFFVAAGAVTFTTMWNKSHGDPLAMERHILSLKDPISHLSFYSFMLSQGYYMNFFEKKAMSTVINEAGYLRMMTRLSYEAMVIGAITSDIVSALSQSISTCSNKWIDGKKDDASLKSCDEAWKQWTVRKKSTQLFPMIVNMIASQAVSGMIHNGAREAFSVVAKSALEKLVLNPKLAFKVVSVDLAIAFIPGTGWVTKGMKFLGKVTHFAGFLAADKFLSVFTNRPLNNFMITFMSYYDFKKINKLWLEADQANWNPALLRKLNSNSEKEFVEEINNYGANMREWRTHLGEKFETDLAGWMEMTKKLLYQESYSFKFYQEFTDNLYETLQNRYRVNSKLLDKSSQDIIGLYPMRTLPFYGVKPGNFKDPDGLGINDLYLPRPYELEKHQKAYVLEVAEKFKNEKFSDQVENEKFKFIVQSLLSADNRKMAQGLLKMNDYIAAIKAEKNGFKDDKMSSTGYITYSADFEIALTKLKTKLGNPSPIVYPFAGFSQAIAANTGYKELDKQADYSNWSATKRYKFNKTPDHMMYNILCGAPLAKVKRYSGAGLNDWINPEFVGPTLMRTSQREQYCSSISTSTNLYNSTINGKPVVKHFLENFDYTTLRNWKLSDEEIQQKFDDFDNQIRMAEKNKDTEIALSLMQQKKKEFMPFALWWKESTQDSLKKAFSEYDQEYKKVADLAFKTFRGEESFYNRFADFYTSYKKQYYPVGVEKSLRAESSVYIQLINRAMTQKVSDESDRKAKKLAKEIKKEKPNIIKSFFNLAKSIVSDAYDNTAHVMNFKSTGTDKDKDYISKAVEISKNKDAFNSMYPSVPKASVRKLNQLLNEYYSFVGINEDRFNDFLDHSKKFDTALNEVLVDAGVMVKVEKSQQTDIADLLSLMSADSGTEATPYTYVPAEQRKLSDLKDKVMHFSKKIVDLVRDGKTSTEELKVQGQKYDKAVSNLDFELNKDVYNTSLRNIRNWYVKSINDLKAVKADAKFIETRKASINLHHEKMMNELFVEINKDPVDTAYRQSIIIAAVDQLRQVEAEIKRFVRMGMLLSNSLEIDSKEQRAAFSH